MNFQKRRLAECQLPEALHPDDKNKEKPFERLTAMLLS